MRQLRYNYSLIIENVALERTVNQQRRYVYANQFQVVGISTVDPFWVT